MKKLKEVSRLVKRLVLFFIGMSIIQFGVAVFLQTSIGSDPFTVFTQGLATVLNKTGLKEFSIVQKISGSTEVTPGVANMIILIALFIIILFISFPLLWKFCLFLLYLKVKIYDRMIFQNYCLFL